MREHLQRDDIDGVFVCDVQPHTSTNNIYWINGIFFLADQAESIVLDPCENVDGSIEVLSACERVIFIIIEHLARNNFLGILLGFFSTGTS